MLANPHLAARRAAVDALKPYGIDVELSDEELGLPIALVTQNSTKWFNLNEFGEWEFDAGSTPVAGSFACTAVETADLKLVIGGAVA